MTEKAKIKTEITQFLESLGAYCRPVNEQSIFVCCRGVFLEIEIIQENEPEQAKVREAGGVTLVVSSLEELKEDFRILGFLIEKNND